MDTENEGAKPSGDDIRVSAPQLSLPKGGGAIRGIGEKFTANPVNGTGSMSVPLFASAGRSGFGPQLSISYDSGAANGSFGFGWNLGLPSITRKTDKGLPLYRDDEESDIFILSGAEDLMPALRHVEGAWIREISHRRVHGKAYEVYRYRPRVEGLFARIERWANLSDQHDTFWRSISRDNVTTWYGRTAESRIADPTDQTRIFSWLICETHDDRGNAIAYRYKPEDSAGIDLTQAHERNRTPQTRSAQRYIKRILYGNRSPYFPDLTAVEPTAHPNDWCFELVFDYGEHDLSEPLPDDAAAEWRCRRDPFSTYRSCFEVRTYRLCQRVLMFHHFPDQPNIGFNCLVRSTNLEHSSPGPHDPSQPFYSYLQSVTQRGYVRDRSGGYLAKSLPPVEFDYTSAVIDETLRDVDAESLHGLPEGIDGIRYRWVDLDGEGVSGILSEQGGSWYYKPNLSPANQHIVDGAELTLPRFGPSQLVARQPVAASLTAGARLVDMSGDGMLDVVDYESPTPGYYERTESGDWQPFRVFRSIPVLDWHNPNLTFVDLTGDGFPDLLISEDMAFWWNASRSIDGFGPGQRVPQALDEEKGPHLIFADGTESIFLADMSGDGLNDLVRVRCGEVCYWPNRGYGRFGTKVTMDGSPWFDEQDRFDGRRIRLADIDGSGTTDIVYFASNAIHLYFNQSGNTWGAPQSLKHFPAIESVSSATVIDLLGNGTACLVWSSSLPFNAQRPLRYIDLMGGQKPHLLVGTRNNMGAETVVDYAPSTRFYVADKRAGTPWLTRLPFPVYVVERVESYDYINRNRFTTRYSYHHGYYDGVEREFRGFGRVDQLDTEEVAALAEESRFPQATNRDPAVALPPVRTMTWYHTGAFFGEGRVSRHFQNEYYAEGDASDALAGLRPEQLKTMLLEDTVLPRTVLLQDGSRQQYNFSPEELREACRALRGLILRQEVYALDGTDRADRPYSASERNYTIEVLQPQGPNLYGVFVAHARESIDFHYERALYEVTGDTICHHKNPARANSRRAADPRVTHAVTLAVDPYNNPLRAVSVAYGRRYRDPSLTPSDQARQSTLLATCIENDYTNPFFTDDKYRTPVSSEARTYELLQLRPDEQHPGLTNLLRFGELQQKLAQAMDGAHDVPFEDIHPTGLKTGHLYRRLVKQIRTYYRPDDLGASAGNQNALLPLGRLEALAITGVSYQLALTPGLIQHQYRREGARLLPDPATVLGSTTGDGGGYVDVDGDDRWWIPSGRSYFLPERSAAESERAEALRHFFQARRFEDSFGNATTIDYDAPYDLLPSRVVDAAGNAITSINDYRALASVQLTDPNGNRRAVSLDALGLVAGTAVMGKTTEHLGDSFEAFIPDLTQSQIDAFVGATDPHTLAAELLGTATTRVVHDVHRFYSSRRAAPDDPSQWQPVFAAFLMRETHVSDLASDETSAIQISFGYSDGFGREIQKKMQCEPGPLIDHGPVVNPRWVGTGWVILNNKGKPVREYEPFFSGAHAFEFGVTVGVSPVLFYDPLERVVATLHPNHTYDKIVFDPWRQTAYDVNDTVAPRNDQTGDPRTDPDIRGLMAGHFGTMGAAATTWQTWYAERIEGEIGEFERDAAVKAQAHADTASTGYFDTLGRIFLKVMRNRVICAGHSLDGTEQEFDTRVELDIEGQHLSVRDALAQPGDPLGRVIARYAYDMLGKRIYQLSMEANARWILLDTSGKPIRTWDSRGHNFTSTYDGLRRPIGQFVRGTTAGSDPRTLNRDLLVDRIEYGESLGNAQALNLRTRMYRHFDSAGVATGARLDAVGDPVEAFDFKGNPLRSTRRLVSDYAAISDWQLEPQLEEESFESGIRYDALNRPIQSIAPHSTLARGRHNVVQPVYNEASLLERVDAWLAFDAEPDGMLDPAVLPPSPVGVANIDYDAKGQRLSIAYKNDVTTFYNYDRFTFRLMHLLTVRPSAAFPGDCPNVPPAGWPGCQVQNLRYAYDPIGNVTHIRDDAQQTIYFRNKRVEPSCDYTYDAVYRLIEGTGREHLGQGGMAIPHSNFDACRVGLLGAEATGQFAPNDGNAMGRYVERYVYDAVDNILQMQHRGRGPGHSGWTRHYTYAEASLIEDGRTSNRLTNTTLNPNGADPFAESFLHDAHGNLVRMPHLGNGSPEPNMVWDYRDQLCRVDLGGGGEAFYLYDSSGERIRKVRRKAPGLTEERIYLGGFEIFRRHAGTIGEARLTLERETLHLMDDRQRIAIVETRTDEERSDHAPLRLIRYQIANELGTAILELDYQARIISYEEYSPYGSSTYQAVRSQTETPKRYRYTGKERDEESGLYYHGARYFAPWLGRWTQCDPEEFRDGPNLYTYTSCNPVNLRDSTGRFEEPGHGAETYELALAAGFKEDDAAQLALATEGVDHDPAKVPTNAEHIVNGITVQWHFLDKAKALHQVEADIKKGVPSLKELGEHLHTLEDVGFKDAPGPHTRGKGSGLLTVFVGIALAILALVGAIAWGISAGSVLVGLVAGVVLETHAIFDFLGLSRLFAGEFGLGSFAHPWRRTERGEMSTPLLHVADELYQDPKANKTEFVKIFDLLSAAAQAKYKRRVVSSRKMADDAIARGVNADTPDKILKFLQERPRMPSGARVKKSYLEHVEAEATAKKPQFSDLWKTKSPWNIGNIDITVGNTDYQVYRDGNSYKIRKSN